MFVSRIHTYSYINGTATFNIRLCTYTSIVIYLKIAVFHSGKDVKFGLSATTCDIRGQISDVISYRGADIPSLWGFRTHSGGNNKRDAVVLQWHHVNIMASRITGILNDWATACPRSYELKDRIVGLGDGNPPVISGLPYKRLATLQWRQNGRDSVSNYQPHDCLLSRLFRRRSKKTSKLRVTGLCAGNSPGTGEFPAQRASNAENVSIWWRHHECGKRFCGMILSCITALPYELFES